MEQFSGIIKTSRQCVISTLPALTKSTVEVSIMAEQSLPKRTFVCKICSNQFTSYNVNPQFCSRSCKVAFQCAPVSFGAAVILYENGMTQTEIAERLGVTQKAIHGLFRRNGYQCRVAAKRDQFGNKNHMWKGDLASYTAFHHRVKQAFGMPQKCEVCETDDPTKSYDWANLTGRYEDVNDYKRMCRSCHWKFDNKQLNFKGAIGGRPSPTQLATKGVDAK